MCNQFNTLTAFPCVIIAFITRPHSFNISEGETENFSCTGTHTSSFGMSWRVNGIGLYNHIHRNIVQHQEEVLPGGARRSILTVPGIPINDNINVACVLSPFKQKLVYSGLAFLRIQGIYWIIQTVILANFYSILSSTINRNTRSCGGCTAGAI